MRPTLDEIVRAASSGIPRPTHLFMLVASRSFERRRISRHRSLPDHLDALRSSIIAHASSSFLSSWAWGRKLVDLSGGSLTENTSFDKIGGLSQARRATLGYSKTEPWLNGVVVAGGSCQLLSYKPLVLTSSIVRQVLAMSLSSPLPGLRFPSQSSTRTSNRCPPHQSLRRILLTYNTSHHR